MSGDEVVASVAVALLGIHTGAIIALAIYLGRTRERMIRLEEWQRLTEKRMNGSNAS